MDEVENELKIACAPITWPIGCGKLFKGVYHLYKDETYLYQTGKGHTIQEVRIVKGLDNPDLDAAVGEELAAQLRDELELVKGASHEFDKELFLSGEITPVFFGTALGNFGVDHMLDGLVEWAPRRCRAKPTPVKWKRKKRSSPASCLKFRPTWTRNTATAWPLCAWCPVSMKRA
jgi:peptide chain release factor 3